MIYLSIDQILELWVELEDARIGANGYGGDTAEIYAYRLLPCSPTLSLTGETGDAARREAARQAALNLIEVLRLFEARRDVNIYIDGARFGPWLVLEPLVHRVHVRVERKGGADG